MPYMVWGWDRVWEGAGPPCCQAHMPPGRSHPSVSDAPSEQEPSLGTERLRELGMSRDHQAFLGETVGWRRLWGSWKRF